MANTSNKIFGLFLISNLIFDSGCKPEKKQTPNDNKKRETQADPVKTTKSEDSASPQGFLTRQDTVKPENLREISEEELGELLNSKSELYPEESETTEKDCFSDDLEKTPLKLQNKWITFQVKKDYADCMTTGSRSYEEFGVRGFFVLTGEGPAVNMSELDGKKARDLKSFFKKNEFMRNLSRSEVEIKIRGKEDDRNFAFRQIITNSGENGSPCEKKDSIVIFCEMKAITIHDKLKNLNAYESVKLNNAKGQDGDTFFSSGTAEFEFNNWRGEVTYKGKNTPPTWTATNGKIKTRGTLKQRSKGD